MMLNARKVDAAKGKEKSYKLSDGGGLYLQVEPNGSRYWRMKYRFAGKEKRLSFGVECGHTFVMNVSFSHTISPSALSGQRRIKELMDALPPDERQKALEPLLAAKESH